MPPPFASSAQRRGASNDLAEVHGGGVRGRGRERLSPDERPDVGVNAVTRRAPRRGRQELRRLRGRPCPRRASFHRNRARCFSRRLLAAVRRMDAFVIVDEFNAHEPIGRTVSVVDRAGYLAARAAHRRPRPSRPPRRVRHRNPCLIRRSPLRLAPPASPNARSSEIRRRPLTRLSMCSFHPNVAEPGPTARALPDRVFPRSDFARAPCASTGAARPIWPRACQ